MIPRSIRSQQTDLGRDRRAHHPGIQGGFRRGLRTVARLPPQSGCSLHHRRVPIQNPGRRHDDQPSHRLDWLLPAGEGPGSEDHAGRDEARFRAAGTWLVHVNPAQEAPRLTALRVPPRSDSIGSRWRWGCEGLTVDAPDSANIHTHNDETHRKSSDRHHQNQ